MRNNEDFSLPDPIIDFLEANFSSSEFNRLKERTDRSVLKVAPLGENTGTKIIPRWEILERHPQREQLHASESVCRKIRKKLITQLILCEDSSVDEKAKSAAKEIIGDTSNTLICPHSGNEILLKDIKKSLKQTTVLGSDEIPIGFSDSPVNGGEFTLDNVKWLNPPLKLFKLRSLFEDYGPLLEKVQRKTYKTDRRLTGTYQTNREHRWESHPNDPQSSSRFVCWKIEGKILSQIFTFDNADINEDTNMEDFLDITDSNQSETEEIVKSFLGKSPESGSFRCPITGDHINFQDFIENILDSEHGQSDYHIGHLDPLATDIGKHEPDNISWITELGNRVQGESPLKNITQRIFQMAEFHKERLDLNWEETENWSPEDQ